MDLILAAAQSASVPGDVEQNVSHHLRFGAMASARGVQLLVFPELSLIGYELGLAREHVLHPDSRELQPLRQLAADSRMTIVAGGPLEIARGELHIAAFVFLPDDSITTYTKVHVHSSEMHVFTPGPGGAALRIADTNVALAICADASHPQHAALAAARGANVYAAGVMIDEPGYVQKMPLLKGYAVEHKMAVLMANYSGVTGGEVSAGKSAIWSEEGTVVAACDDAGEALVMGTKANEVWRGEVLTIRR